MEALPNFQRRVLMATSLSYVIVVLDTSIVNVALARISASLGGEVTSLQWVINAYTLTFASLLLTGGSLGDRFGARNVYLAGLLTFAVASAMCGGAPQLSALVVARMLQGVGACLLVPSSLALIGAAYPDPVQRAGAIGVWAGCGGIAMAAGPLVGGLLIHGLGWRSIFLVNVPIAAVGAWLTTRVPASRTQGRPRALDLPGQLLAVAALGGTVAVLIEVGKHGWQSPVIQAGIVVTIMAWITFIVVERRRPQPMLPLSFFRSPVFSAAVFISMVSALVFYGLFFLLSLYFQEDRKWSPLQTGCSFLPLTALVMAGSFASGPLARLYGSHRVLTGGLLLYAAGFAGLLALADDAPYWRIALSYPLVGFSSGVVTPAATAVLMSTVDNARTGVAAGVLNASRQSGAALGVALFGALLAGVQPLASGIRTALIVAIVLSLLAALCWSLAAGRIARDTRIA